MFEAEPVRAALPVIAERSPLPAAVVLAIVLFVDLVGCLRLVGHGAFHSSFAARLNSLAAVNENRTNGCIKASICWWKPFTRV